MESDKKEEFNEPQTSASANSKEAANQKAENADSEKRYKTAFFIMTGLAVLLFISLIATLYIQRQSVKQVEFIEETVIRVFTLPEESQGELRVNINTADINELTLLPGIGESRARDIIDYRNEYGRFTQPEDLLNIRGIGEATLQNILPYIVFEDAD